MDEHSDHDEHIHLPPNSWVPISLSFSLAFLLVSLVTFQYPLSGSLSYGAVLVPISGVLTLGVLAAWLRGARTEFKDLPENLDAPAAETGGH